MLGWGIAGGIVALAGIVRWYWQIILDYNSNNKNEQTVEEVKQRSGRSYLPTTSRRVGNSNENDPGSSPLSDGGEGPSSSAAASKAAVANQRALETIGAISAAEGSEGDSDGDVVSLPSSLDVEVGTPLRPSLPSSAAAEGRWEDDNDTALSGETHKHRNQPHQPENGPTSPSHVCFVESKQERWNPPPRPPMSSSYLSSPLPFSSSPRSQQRPRSDPDDLVHPARRRHKLRGVDDDEDEGKKDHRLGIVPVQPPRPPSGGSLRAGAAVIKAVTDVSTVAGCDAAVDSAADKDGDDGRRRLLGIGPMGAVQEATTALTACCFRPSPSYGGSDSDSGNGEGLKPAFQWRHQAA